MELRQLATFRAVAQELSFTRAAQVLDYAQSSVTAQIQALEEDLGVALFERIGRRVRLTEAGEQLLYYAEKFARLEEEVRAIVSGNGEARGTLTIGAPETLCTYRLPAVLTNFRSRFPDVRLIFRPSNTCDDVLHAVGVGQIDLGFLLEKPLEAPSLVVEPLLLEPLLVLAHPDHPLAQVTRVQPEDLRGESVLLTEAGCGYRAIFERILDEAGVRPATTLEFSSVESIKQCVMAGMGVTILPAIAVAAEVAQGRLAALAWSGLEDRIVTQMLWHKDKWLSPALRAFMDVTRETLLGSARPRQRVGSSSAAR